MAADNLVSQKYSLILVLIESVVIGDEHSVYHTASDQVHGAVRCCYLVCTEWSRELPGWIAYRVMPVVKQRVQFGKMEWTHSLPPKTDLALLVHRIGRMSLLEQTLGGILPLWCV